MTRAKAPSHQAYLHFAHMLADLAGKAILPHFRKPLSIHNKAGKQGFDPVTAADKAAERAIRRAIAVQFPQHGIVGEEFASVAGEGRYKWVVDPIDGTRAFIMGAPLWGTLIGLLDGNEPVLGLMDQPFTGERFWSARGKARARAPDGRVRTLKTRACAALADATLTTTHPDLFTTQGEAAAFGQLKSRARMTRYGGDCYGYCLLAAGFIDVIVEAGLKPYDVVALIPIIESAGGIITTWDGKSAAQGGRIIAAGDARVHKEAIAVLRTVV